MIFFFKFFSYYILLTDQISLSRSPHFLRQWAMCTTIVCFPRCDVIKFENNLIFRIFRISQNSQVLSSCRPQPCNFIKKDTLAQVFSNFVVYWLCYLTQFLDRTFSTYFFISIVFSWVSLRMLPIWPIWALYYTYNMLKIIISVAKCMT